jgi:hypothetical protein
VVEWVYVVRCIDGARLCTKTLWERSLTAISESATKPIPMRSNIGVGDTSHTLSFLCKGDGATLNVADGGAGSRRQNRTAGKL